MADIEDVDTTTTLTETITTDITTITDADGNIIDEVTETTTTTEVGFQSNLFRKML